MNNEIKLSEQIVPNLGLLLLKYCTDVEVEYCAVFLALSMHLIETIQDVNEKLQFLQFVFGAFLKAPLTTSLPWSLTNVFLARQYVILFVLLF